MVWNPLRTARESRERELEAAERWRIARKLATVACIDQSMSGVNGLGGPYG